jgi:hypothetical protein
MRHPSRLTSARNHLDTAAHLTRPSRERDPHARLSHLDNDAARLALRAGAAHRALRALSPHVPSGSLRDPLLASAPPPHGHGDLVVHHLVHRVHGTRGSGSLLRSSPRSSPQGGCLIEGVDAPCLPAASHGWGVAVRLAVRAPARLASRLPGASTGTPPAPSSDSSGLCVPVPHLPRLRVVSVTGAVGRSGYRSGIEVAPCRGLPHGRVGANRLRVFCRCGGASRVTARSRKKQTRCA